MPVQIARTYFPQGLICPLSLQTPESVRCSVDALYKLMSCHALFSVQAARRETLITGSDKLVQIGSFTLHCMRSDANATNHSQRTSSPNASANELTVWLGPWTEKWPRPPTVVLWDLYSNLHEAS